MLTRRVGRSRRKEERKMTGFKEKRGKGEMKLKRKAEEKVKEKSL